uniref:Uncharacterized protein n=1 Tax=Meloidogyne enterolobii TaxID=390850 RepID=A0A6V7WQB7_MELEN|nr:unnamed protein product [Meloidogyne enterolobii]
MESNIFSSPYQLPDAIRQMIVASSNGVITEKTTKNGKQPVIKDNL